MRVVRRLITLSTVVVNATLVTAVAAGVVHSRPVTTERTAGASATATEAVSPAPSLPDLGPVTFEALPPVPSRRPDEVREAPQQLTQTITVVIQGGTLRLRDDGATVRLTEARPGTFVGEFDGLTVVDARGTLAGWVASVAVADMAGGGDARVRVHPDKPEVVYGERRGLRRSPTALVATGEAVPVFSASSGNGGGTYSSGGHLEVRAPALAGQGGLTVDLVFSVLGEEKPGQA